MTRKKAPKEQYYLITLDPTSNPRSIPALKVGNEHRKGLVLQTGNRRQRGAQRMLIDRDFWDQLKKEGDHIWKNHAAPVVLNIEGPFDDDTAEERVHFCGEDPPKSISTVETLYEGNHPGILAAWAKSSPDFKPRCDRARRTLIQGGADQVEAYIFGRQTCDPDERRAKEDPSDAGYTSAQIWLRFASIYARGA